MSDEVKQTQTGYRVVQDDGRVFTHTIRIDINLAGEDGQKFLQALTQLLNNYVEMFSVLKGKIK